MSRKSFTDSQDSNVESTGHSLEFLANSGTVMTNGLTVDLDTLSAPLIDGTLKLVKDLKPDDKLTVPLLVDHWPSVDHQAGTVTKLWLDDTGLMAMAKLSDVEEGKLIQQLAKDGALTNSFSITIDFSTEPGRDGVIHDSELVEISVVYRGADSKAAFRSLNQRGTEMGKKTVQMDTDDIDKKIATFGLTKDEAAALSDSIQSAMQSALDDITKAVAGATDPSDDDSDDDSGDDDSAPKGGEPDAPEQSANQRKKNTVGMPQIIVNKANNGVEGTASLAKVGTDRKTYLDSPQAFNDYAEFIFNHPTEGNADKVTGQWAEFARNKMGEHASFGISTDDVDKLVPTSVLKTIEDIFNTRGSGLWPLLNHTGLDVSPTYGANEVGLDGDDGRAHGYPVAKYGTEKMEERIALQTRTLLIDYVYKYIRLNKGDIRRTRNPGALLKYVLQELPNRIIQTIERAVVLNRANVAGDWADMKMFRSILDDSLETQAIAGTGTIPGEQFALRRAPKADESLVESFRRAAGKVKAAGQKILITDADTLADLQFSKDKNGDWLLPLGADPAAAVGVSQIITPEWYFERDKANALGVIMVPSAYQVLGDNNVEAFANFAMRTNEQEYLQEIFTGGGLATIKAACVIPPAATTPATRTASTLAERVADTNAPANEGEQTPGEGETDEE